MNPAEPNAIVGAAPVIAVPVKPFGAAKRRLSSVFDDGRRRLLSQRLAIRVTTAAARAGALPLVLSADAEVTQWSRDNGVEVLLDEGSSLDQAATSAARWAAERGRPWIICHADLPLLEPTDLRGPVVAAASGRPVIAPSTNGGTSLLGWSPPTFGFSYGVGSFRRHLGRLAAADPVVFVSTALSLDLDDPTDLESATRDRRGAWLSEFQDPSGDRWRNAAI